MSPQSSKPMLMFPLGRRKIGRYELLHPLASGGMATVFAGRFFGMGGFEKLVSVKVIHPHLAGRKEFVEMFLDEARLSAKIHHPNAIEIFEVGEDNGLLFIVAELVQGRNLDQVLKAAQSNGTPLSPRLYLSVIARVCDALHAAHSLVSSDGSPMNIVHRDISPSNILISYGGHIKLIDFGIAFAAERLSTTRSDVVKGKRGYAAPEQFNKATVDRRIDIFSLGVVLYYLATGKHPFPGETETQQVHKLLHGNPVSPCVLGPDIPLGLERTILKALAKEPDNRQQTAEELGLELRSLLIPLGGIADNVDIAGWMEHAFSRQLIDEKQAFEQASQALLEADATPPPDSLPNLKLDQSEPQGDDLTGAATHLLTRRPLEVPSPDTELVDHLLVRTKSHRRPRWLVLILGAATVGLILVLYPMVRQTLQSSAVSSPTTDTGFAEPTEPSGAHTSSLKVPDLTLEKIAQPRQLPVDTALDTTLTAGSVELLLHGLPEHCRVTLDEKPVMVTRGKIQIPGDGKPRQLSVFAKGFLPYQETVSPLADDELTLHLTPQGRPRQTSTKHKTAVKKSKRGTLAQSPYDTQ